MHNIENWIYNSKYLLIRLIKNKKKKKLFFFFIIIISVTYPHTWTFWIEEEWEKELEAELQDYEVVNEDKNVHAKNDNWEEDMEAMLKDDDIKWIRS